MQKLNKKNRVRLSNGRRTMKSLRGLKVQKIRPRIVSVKFNDVDYNKNWWEDWDDYRYRDYYKKKYNFARNWSEFIEFKSNELVRNKRFYSFHPRAGFNSIFANTTMVERGVVRSWFKDYFEKKFNLISKQNNLFLLDENIRKVKADSFFDLDLNLSKLYIDNLNNNELKKLKNKGRFVHNLSKKLGTEMESKMGLVKKTYNFDLLNPLMTKVKVWEKFLGNEVNDAEVKEEESNYKKKFRTGKWVAPIDLDKVFAKDVKYLTDKGVDGQALYDEVWAIDGLGLRFEVKQQTMYGIVKFIKNSRQIYLKFCHTFLKEIEKSSRFIYLKSLRRTFYVLLSRIMNVYIKFEKAVKGLAASRDKIWEVLDPLKDYHIEVKSKKMFDKTLRRVIGGDVLRFYKQIKIRGRKGIEVFKEVHEDFEEKSKEEVVLYRELLRLTERLLDVQQTCKDLCKRNIKRIK